MINKKHIDLIIITIVLLNIDCELIAQKSLPKEKILIDCPSKIDSILKKTVYTQVDSMPEFGEGGASIVSYFLSNFRISKNDEDFQTFFKFEFIIDIDGRVMGERIPGKNYEQQTRLEK